MLLTILKVLVNFSVKSLTDLILAQAEILKDKNATSYGDVKKDLIEGGAKYQENSVTQDGNIITANGPEATKEFAEKIVNSLK
jgi:protease I